MLIRTRLFMAAAVAAWSFGGANAVRGAVPPPATPESLPEGFALRTFTFPETRMSRIRQHPGNGDVYAVSIFGPLYRVDVHAGTLSATTVADFRNLGIPFEGFTGGLDFDAAGNVYLSSSHGQIVKGTYDAVSETFAWSQFKDLQPLTPEVGAHGYSGLTIDRNAQKLYINYGAIKQGNDPQTDPEPNYGWNTRILRMDLSGENLAPFCRGIRNNFGLTVRADGKLFGVENSTDCDSAEEFNLLEENLHYGHPFRFASDRSGNDLGLFPCEEQTDSTGPFEAAWGNLGPDGKPGPGERGYLDGGIYYGFHPHSSPTGVSGYDPAVMDPDAIKFPADFHGRMFVARFGQQLPDVADVGFDVVSLALNEADRTFVCNAFLEGLARPTDIVCATNGKVYILEFDQTRSGIDAGIGNGRLLEVAYTVPPPIPARATIAGQQHLRVISNGTGYQELFYNYTTGELWVSPYGSASGAVPYTLPQEMFVGLYHYDYGAGRFSQAVYQMKDALR